MRCIPAALALLHITVAAAQEPVAPKPPVIMEHVSKANYELASRWTPQKIGKLVFDLNIEPHWFETSDRFWYAYEGPKGRTWIVVDPAAKTKTPLFDAAKMAAALTGTLRIPYDAQHLPMQNVRLIERDSALLFQVAVPIDADIPGLKKAEPGRGPNAPRTRDVYLQWNLAAAKLTLLGEHKPLKKARWASISPDEKTVVFARGNNLYMMDAANYAKAAEKEDDASVVETQITTDAEEHFGYARRLNEDEKRPYRFSDKNKTPRVPAIAIHWSKDSKKFAVVRLDQRKVSDLWVINTLANPRPVLESYRYAMPGEANVPQSSLEVFDIATKGRVMVKSERFPDQQVAIFNAPVTFREREAARKYTVERNTEDGGGQDQGTGGGRQAGPEPTWLASGSGKLYFNRTSRDLKKIDVCVADPATGEVKTLIEERLNTYVETRPLRLINDGQELVHWSERDGWGHYYLFDADGKLKNQITAGEFYTSAISHIDEKTRTMYFVANGREADEDPYYDHLYRIGLDGSGIKMLAPGNGTHTIAMADSGRYFVDTYSRVNREPTSALYDLAGNTLTDLPQSNLAGLKESGFISPEPFKVKADDGITDLYGVMYKPFDFSPNKKYPIIAYVYPGPQTESVTKAFSPRSNNIALAQLGFIVIEVGNRGGHPQRSKWYHNYGYGNLRDYGLADKKAAIEQLARRYPWINADKVGIYGHSGGGFMSTAAMLVYPDFFKVAVSSSGNHENNVYNRWWSEKHHGVREVTDKDGKVKFEYNIEKNSDLAKNLKGRLMLATGDIDDNVHMAGTLRVADALIKANKRFDFVMLPGKRHGYGNFTEYFFWVRADYFVKHLLGDYSQPVDILELTRERQQTGNTRANAAGGPDGEDDENQPN
ncbi:X-Pro dipeptidyl-peptidase [Bryobacterales bacterium F-183]|nr:X-Pro dipeptidyl-peptidase [Bryobacterales bacterium F-183]